MRWEQLRQATGFSCSTINDPSGKYLYSVSQSSVLSAYSIDRTTAEIKLIDTETTGPAPNGTALVGLQ